MQLYKHNADTYKELCGKLQVYNKCGIIQCTGSGKGAIASKLILDNMSNKKILLLGALYLAFRHSKVLIRWSGPLS